MHAPARAWTRMRFLLRHGRLCRVHHCRELCSAMLHILDDCGETCAHVVCSFSTAHRREKQIAKFSRKSSVSACVCVSILIFFGACVVMCAVFRIGGLTRSRCHYLTCPESCNLFSTTTMIWAPTLRAAWPQVCWCHVLISESKEGHK